MTTLGEYWPRAAVQPRRLRLPFRRPRSPDIAQMVDDIERATHDELRRGLPQRADTHVHVTTRSPS